MALNYGFYPDTHALADLAKRRFKALDEEDKKFFHNVLPFALMLGQIGTLLPETAETLVGRLKWIAPDILDTIWKNTRRVGLDDTQKYLERFHGFSANVITATHTEFKKHMGKLFDRDIKKLDNEWSNTSRNPEYKLMCVHGVGLLDEEELPLVINDKWLPQAAKNAITERLKTLIPMYH